MTNIRLFFHDKHHHLFEKRAGLDLSVASELDFVLANAELLVRHYPFAFALSTTNAITLHVENKTYWEGTVVSRFVFFVFFLFFFVFFVFCSIYRPID